jgi:D-tyrosyl-tRNA(Tyr) deacylase
MMVGDEVVGDIGRGALALVGVARGDDDRAAAWMSGKLANLRIFPDEDGKMNGSLMDVRGDALVVSQFTLYGDASRGRRPSFVQAAAPEIAEPLIGRVADGLRALGLRVVQGSFGSHMQVELVNDGPVTILLDSERG